MTTPHEAPQPACQADGNPFDAFLAAAAKVGSMSLPVAVLPEQEQESCERQESPRADLSLLNRSFGQRSMRQHTDLVEALKQAANIISEDGTIIAHLKKRAVPQPVADDWPAGWRVGGFNYCLKSAAASLRYLASNPVPSGGEEAHNAACLQQQAGELDVTRERLAKLARQAPSREPLSELASKVLNRMVEGYRLRPADVATACDEQIDRSGNLLGWLREASRITKEGAAPQAPQAQLVAVPDFEISKFRNQHTPCTQLLTAIEVERHADDEAVDRFAALLKAKLAAARAKGRSGWSDPAWPAADINRQMHEHAAKGDPLDVAAYAMFLALRGEATTSLNREPNPTREDLIATLTFYAEKGHFQLADESQWDTVSGEPANLWCDSAGTATIEDGSMAKLTLEGKFPARLWADDGDSGITKEGGQP